MELRWLRQWYTLIHTFTRSHVPRSGHIRGPHPPVRFRPRLPTLHAESHRCTRTDVRSDTVVAVHTPRSHPCPHMSAPGLESTPKCQQQGTWRYFTFPAADMRLAWPDMGSNATGVLTRQRTVGVPRSVSPDTVALHSCPASSLNADTGPCADTVYTRPRSTSTGASRDPERGHCQFRGWGSTHVRLPRIRAGKETQLRSGPESSSVSQRRRT